MKWRRFLIVLFLAALIAPSAGLFKEPDARQFKINEKRKPQVFPDLEKGLRPAQAGFERWLSDRLAFRSALTAALGNIYFALGASIKPEQVLIGRDNWLFLGNVYGWTVDQYRGLEKPRAGEVEGQVRMLKDMQDLCESRGIYFIMVVAPDKQFIYPEKLPSWMKAWEGPNLLKLFDEMSKKMGVNFLDATPYVQKGKREGRKVFMERDSHWSAAGAFQVYLTLMERMKEKVPGIRSLDPAGMTYRVMPSTSDMTDVIHVGLPPSSNEYPWAWDGPMIPLTEFCDGKTTRLEPTKQVVPNVFGPCLVQNPALPQGPKLLYVGDSFGKNLIPYLQQTFPVVINMHYGALNTYPLPRLLNYFYPDVVIVEMIQRGLIYDFISPKWLGGKNLVSGQR